MLQNKQGITIIELIVIMLIMAVVASMALPRALRPTPERQVDQAARALTRDLEQVRMRAMAAKRSVRVRFYPASDFYTAFMDVTPARLSRFTESGDEVRASGLLTQGSREGVPGVPLPKGVVFGTGAASAGPSGLSASDPVTLADDRLELSARGMVVPEGSGGVIYLTHEDDLETVAAVTISGAGAFQTWRLRGDRWIR